MGEEVLVSAIFNLRSYIFWDMYSYTGTRETKMESEEEGGRELTGVQRT